MSTKIVITASELHRAGGKVLKLVALLDEHLVIERNGYPIAVLLSFRNMRSLAYALAHPGCPPGSGSFPGQEVEKLQLIIGHFAGLIFLTTLPFYKEFLVLCVDPLLVTTLRPPVQSGQLHLPPFRRYKPKEWIVWGLLWGSRPTINPKNHLPLGAKRYHAFALPVQLSFGLMFIFLDIIPLRIIGEGVRNFG